MKPKEYMFALLLTLCVVFSILAYRNSANNINTCSEQMYALNRKIDAINDTLHNKAVNIVLPETILTDMYDMAIESKSMRDYIRGFSEFMESEYDFTGHQARWGE
jgi:hypothetical protein